MSLELINTFGTVTTVVIVAATAIAALVQLRHLRAGNQITAILSIEAELSGKAFTNAQSLVAENLGAALNDQAFRDFIIARSRGQAPPEVGLPYAELRDAAHLMANTFEELAILVKNGIMDKSLVLDSYCWQVLRAWKPLEKLIALTRGATQLGSIWENFEYLAVLSEDWLQKHPSAYPKGVRRIQLNNPWPVPPLPATRLG